MSSYYIDNYKKAIKNGVVESRTSKILVYGAAGSGKTSFLHLLLDEPPPTMRHSTPLAVRPVTVHQIDITNGKWKKQETIEERLHYLARAIKGTVQVQERSKQVTYAADRTSKDSTKVTANSAGPNDASRESNSEIEIQDKHDISDRTKQEVPTDSEVNETDTAPEEDSIQKQIIEMMGKVTGEDLVASYIALRFIDSGGQPQFQEVLPIFLSNLSFCFFVIKLSEKLDDHPEACYYENDVEIGKFPSTQSHKQLLQHCLQAMQSFVSSSYEGERDIPIVGTHKDKDDNVSSVMFVGTHKDKEDDCSEKQKEKNEEICNITSNFTKCVNFIDFAKDNSIFPVNAKSPSEEDKEVATIICKELEEDNSSREFDHIPLRWYVLELFLEQKASMLLRPVLSMQECLEEGQKLNMNEVDLKSALEYLHGLSAVLYYGKVLPNVVFVDSQHPLDIFSDLVIKQYKLVSKKPFKNFERDFYNKAELRREYLGEICSRNLFDDIFSLDDLVKLFQELFIIAEIDKSTDKFFVPALLKALNEKELDEHRGPASECPLVIKFSEDSPVLGVFCVMTCFLLSKSSWELCKDSETVFYRNCIKFNVPEHHLNVTFIGTATHLEFHISSARKVCRQIYETVEKGLQEAKETLSYKMDFKIALLCPCGKFPYRVHTADIVISDSEKVWVCSKNNDESRNLKSGQRRWCRCDLAQGILEKCT